MNKISMDTNNPFIGFNTGNQKQVAHNTWFRGEHCNFNPTLANLYTINSIIEYVLDGWIPSSPLIGYNTKVTAFGSCFAEHISNWLKKRKYNILNKEDSNSYVVRFGEGMVNTFSIRQQFEWAWQSKQPEGDLWHGYDATSFGYDEEIRIETKKLFDTTHVFVITLGLSEVWYDELTGGVFWRAVPMRNYDPKRHKFRVSSVSENVDNIREIYNLIKKYNPQAKIIFTLSPIPLVATFRPISCVTANSASKAILKAALDEVQRELVDDGRVFYWPSYEMITEIFPHPWKSDRRHVKEDVLNFIMSLFEFVYCEYPDSGDFHINERWFIARSSSGLLPNWVGKSIKERDVVSIEKLAVNLDSMERFSEANDLRDIITGWGQ